MVMEERGGILVLYLHMDINRTFNISYDNDNEEVHVYSFNLQKDLLVGDLVVL